MIKHKKCQDWKISKKVRWQVQRFFLSYQNWHTHSHVETIRYMKNIQYFSHRLSLSQERKFLLRARRSQWRKSITKKQWNNDQKEWHRKKIQKMTFEKILNSRMNQKIKKLQYKIQWTNNKFTWQLNEDVKKYDSDIRNFHIKNSTKSDSSN